MYCKHCGHEIDDDSTFCKLCGQKIDATAQQELSAEIPTEAPSKRKKIPRLFFCIIAIILIGVIIMLIIPKGGKGFLNLHDGMTHAQVHRTLGKSTVESPKYDRIIVDNFFGYQAKIEVLYDDDGLMRFAEATVIVNDPQSGIDTYNSIFESICAEVGDPTYSTGPEESAIPSAKWYGLSTADYYKNLSIEYSDSSGVCRVRIGN